MDSASPPVQTSGPSSGRTGVNIFRAEGAVAQARKDPQLTRLRVFYAHYPNRNRPELRRRHGHDPEPARRVRGFFMQVRLREQPIGRKRGPPQRLPTRFPHLLRREQGDGQAQDLPPRGHTLHKDHRTYAQSTRDPSDHGRRLPFTGWRGYHLYHRTRNNPCLPQYDCSFESARW